MSVYLKWVCRNAYFKLTGMCCAHKYLRGNCLPIHMHTIYTNTVCKLLARVIAIFMLLLIFSGHGFHGSKFILTFWLYEVFCLPPCIIVIAAAIIIVSYLPCEICDGKTNCICNCILSLLTFQAVKSLIELNF